MIAEAQRWWVEDLPAEQPEVFENYLSTYPQYVQEEGSTQNPVPFPDVVSPDTVRWFKPSDEKWVNFNVSHQNLLTAMRMGWLPEKPVEEVAEEAAAYQCPNCDYTAKTSVGLKIHKSLRGHK